MFMFDSYDRLHTVSSGFIPINTNKTSIVLKYTCTNVYKKAIHCILHVYWRDEKLTLKDHDIFNFFVLNELVDLFAFQQDVV